MSSFGGSIKLEGASAYKKALSDITQNLKVVSAEMKATASSTDKENMSEKELTAMTKQYNSTLDQQKTALANAKKQLDDLQKEYAQNVTELDKLNKEYDDEKKKLDEIGRTLGTSSDEYKKHKQQSRPQSKLSRILLIPMTATAPRLSFAPSAAA